MGLLGHLCAHIALNMLNWPVVMVVGRFSAQNSVCTSDHDANISFGII